jgi:nitrite reductase (NADH) small subunit
MSETLNESVLESSLVATIGPRVDVSSSWVDVCAETDLERNRGVCALVGDTPVAIFRVDTADGSDTTFALSNIDPFTGASVLSRGIVGSKGDVMKVTSPMLKHAFNIATGESLDDPTIILATFAVRIVAGRVLVASAGS